MKKTNWLAMLLAGALVCGIGVGCGESGEKGEGGEQGGAQHTHTFAEGWTSDGENHWHAATCDHKEEVSGKEAHSFTNGECSVCGYYKIDKDTDPNAIVSDKLTEEEWKEALSEEVLKNLLMYGKSVDDSGRTHELFLSICDYNLQQRLTDNDYADEMIFIDKGETTEGYTRTTGPDKPETWQFFEAPSEQANHQLAILRAFREHYRDVEFREDLGGYVCSGDKLEIPKSSAKDRFLLKFKGGKPCAYGELSGNLGPIAVIYGFGEAEQIVAPSDYEAIG